MILFRSEVLSWCHKSNNRPRLSCGETNQNRCTSAVKQPLNTSKTSMVHNPTWFGQIFAESRSRLESRRVAKPTLGFSRVAKQPHKPKNSPKLPEISEVLPSRKLTWTGGKVQQSNGAGSETSWNPKNPEKRSQNTIKYPNYCSWCVFLAVRGVSEVGFVLIVPPEGGLDSRWDSRKRLCFIHVTVKTVSGLPYKIVMESWNTHASSSSQKVLLCKMFLEDRERSEKDRRVYLLHSLYLTLFSFLGEDGLDKTRTPAVQGGVES